MTKVLEQVRRLIERLTPEPVCDTCIAERIALTEADAAERSTRELAGQGGFERRIEPCTLCGETRTVIRWSR